MTNKVGGGLYRRRQLMQEKPVSLLTFESATNAVFKNRYGNGNLRCDIYDNHVVFNKYNNSDANWYWGGNISAFNSQNKQWLFVPAGTKVKLKVTSDKTKGNMGFNLKNSADTNLQNSWLNCSISSATTVANEKTATEDVYLYVSFNATLQDTSTLNVDIEIYLDGVRVL